MSHFKNPDRFIKRLKNRIEMLERKFRNSKEKEGVRLHSMDCDQTSDQWGEVYDNVLPGDTMIAICYVNSVELYFEDDRRAGKINITVTELRRRLR